MKKERSLASKVVTVIISEVYDDGVVHTHSYSEHVDTLSRCCGVMVKETDFKNKTLTINKNHGELFSSLDGLEEVQVKYYKTLINAKIEKKKLSLKVTGLDELYNSSITTASILNITFNRGTLYIDKLD